jgi:hypothetical protein
MSGKGRLGPLVSSASTIPIVTRSSMNTTVLEEKDDEEFAGTIATLFDLTRDLPDADTNNIYKRIHSMKIDEDEVIKVLEDKDYSLSQVSLPPDLEVIKALWISAFKDVSDEKLPPLFAAAMAIQGYKGNTVLKSVKANVKGRETTLKEALKDNFKFHRGIGAKGPHAINARRVCLVYAAQIRKYLERKTNVVTSMMKKYGKFHPYLFIGGQSTITLSSEATVYYNLILNTDGIDQAEKVKKYFLARKILISNE